MMLQLTIEQVTDNTALVGGAETKHEAADGPCPEEKGQN
jgi:hypothetical protein